MRVAEKPNFEPKRLQHRHEAPQASICLTPSAKIIPDKARLDPFKTSTETFAVIG